MTTTTRTMSELTTQTGVTITADWADDVEIPVLSGLQRQGDVLILPSPRSPATTPAPAAGTAVVRGENGNTHAVFPDPGADVRVDTYSPDPARLLVAVVTVGEGATAWLGHPEHGYLGIGPGTYEVRRQREQADEIRIVAD